MWYPTKSWSSSKCSSGAGSWPELEREEEVSSSEPAKVFEILCTVFLRHSSTMSKCSTRENIGEVCTCWNASWECAMATMLLLCASMITWNFVSKPTKYLVILPLSVLRESCMLTGCYSRAGRTNLACWSWVYLAGSPGGNDSLVDSAYIFFTFAALASPSALHLYLVNTLLLFGI